MSDVVVPEVGEAGMEVTFVGWLKSDGEQVSVGEPIFEVDTGKVTLEVEAYVEGVLVGSQSRYNVRYDVHDVRILLYHHQLIDFYRARFRYPSQVVSREVDEHYVLGAFFRV